MGQVVESLNLRSNTSRIYVNRVLQSLTHIYPCDSLV